MAVDKTSKEYKSTVIPADTKTRDAIGTQLTNVLGEFAGSISYQVLGKYKDPNNPDVKIEVSGFKFIPSRNTPTLSSLLSQIKKSNMTDEQKAKAVAYAGVVGGVDVIVINSIEQGTKSLGIGTPIKNEAGANAEIDLRGNGGKTNEENLTGDSFLPYANEADVRIDDGTNQSVKPQITGSFSTNNTNATTLDAIIGTYNTTPGVKTESFTKDGVKNTLGTTGIIESTPVKKK